MNLRQAEEFLSLSFSPNETIALLLCRQEAAKVAQRIVRVDTALSPRYMRWLAHENVTGANIYLSANPLRPGSHKRTKENVASVRHLYIDIDSDGDARLAALRESTFIPPANAILSTSPGKYQILWTVEGFDTDLQESALKQLALAFGGDPACTDRNRVLRLPGFLNRKYDPACLVTAEYPSATIWLPEDFQDLSNNPPAVVSCPAIVRNARARKHSNSEDDWAWIVRKLTLGKDAIKLTRELAARRPDKDNPIYYAQRTVDIASARLWLLSGIRTDDVITMLESRRRFEIPSALSSARAREITHTAERMIVRRKTA